MHEALSHDKIEKQKDRLQDHIGGIISIDGKLYWKNKNGVWDNINQRYALLIGLIHDIDVVDQVYDDHTQNTLQHKKYQAFDAMTVEWYVSDESIGLRLLMNESIVNVLANVRSLQILQA